ncbi:MAG: hypothetical protein ACKOYP_12405 [Bacteroidota bacterium]
MRLGQLARKLDISPTEIERYLYANGTFIESGSNSKLEDADVQRVIVHFAPGLMSEVNRELEAEHAAELVAEKASLPTEPQVVQSPEATASVPPSNDQEEKPEVIKAPKIELPGLKVLGKIELPEPKKKPERPERDRPREASRSERKEERSDRPWVNRLEIQRQREAKQAEDRKKEEIRQQKEMRALAYYNRQAKGGGKSKSRTRREVADEEPAGPVQKPAPPKTFFGKVWRWLTQAE